MGVRAKFLKSQQEAIATRQKERSKKAKAARLQRNIDFKAMQVTSKEKTVDFLDEKD